MKKINIWILLVTCFSGQVLAQSLTGDIRKTAKSELTIHPILHGTLAIAWNDMVIYVDPYGGAEAFEGIPTPDLVFITDIHGDHHNAKTLAALDLDNSKLIVPKAVYDRLSDGLKTNAIVIANGEEMEVKGILVEAIPMYNLPETADSRHPKGRGNGYIITVDGTRIYISGDTEDIPEMRALRDIDIAFVCMNLPYTMDVTQAASAVLDFKPRVVYPFHYRGGGGSFSDTNKFKQLVEAESKDVEVRLRDWYAQ